VQIATKYSRGRGIGGERADGRQPLDRVSTASQEILGDLAAGVARADYHNCSRRQLRPIAIATGVNLHEACNRTFQRGRNRRQLVGPVAMTTFAVFIRAPSAWISKCVIPVVVSAKSPKRRNAQVREALPRGPPGIGPPHLWGQTHRDRCLGRCSQGVAWPSSETGRSVNPTAIQHRSATRWRSRTRCSWLSCRR
jgi:hypothetical protein